MWSRRNTLPVTIEGLLLDLLPAQNEHDANCKTPCTECNGPADVFDVNREDREHAAICKTKKHSACTVTWVESSALEGEIPSRYAVIGLRSHEMAVVGTYVDPRVLPGFRYRVRTLGENSRSLFQGRAIMLTSIGRGYGRRLTFQPDTGQLNHNNNYFWSDSCSDGFALELEVVSVGDKFTVIDACHVTTGTLEVIHAQGVQKEEPSRKAGEKLVRVQALCRVEWFESGEEQVLPISGTALVTPRQQAARLVNVSLGAHARGFSLEPGAGERRTTVHGARVGDVPISYTVIGLEAHEIPIIGTYVDPRIAPGFHYRVRRLGSSSGRWFFNGRALKLLSIGAGYAKRITFQPDKLNEPQNFFWSDSAHGDGFACEIRGVFPGQKFWVTAGGERLGEASVLRADVPQAEEDSQLLPDGGLQKRVQVEVTCHVNLDSGAHSAAVRVSGTAVLLRRTPRSTAELLRIEDVGMDSQLNLMFVHQNTSVVFYPTNQQ